MTDWWNVFCKTGRIEDYLRYRGVDIYAPRAENRKEQESGGDQDRRAGVKGKQQYR